MLIVDDSKLVRQILQEVLSVLPDVEMVGAAKDAFEARALIKSLDPDVITLDVEMPKMDGIVFLKNIMRLRPMPVVMLSTLTQKGADTTLQALECGAIDFISKPSSRELLGELVDFKKELHQKLLFAASVKVTAKPALKKLKRCELLSNQANLKHKIVALGASTGGTEALRDVLSTLPLNSPAVVVTQHIPESFSHRFAVRLNTHCALEVHEAADGQILQSGNIYIAPGNKHLTIVFKDNQYQCKLSDEGPRNRHKPAVDVMFESLALLTHATIYAGLLTGMGSDGAQGLKVLKDKGFYTLIQSKASSLIWGMPGAAFNLNAHREEVDLVDVSAVLVKNISQGVGP